MKDNPMAAPTNEKVTEADATLRDALNQVRSDAQQLNKSMHGALAARTDATKSDIEGFVQKAKSTADAATATLRTQNAEAKKHLTAAVEKLRAVEKETSRSLKESGQAARAALDKARVDARAAVGEVTEAVAALRGHGTNKSA
jgi:hypothetical protein